MENYLHLTEKARRSVHSILKLLLGIFSIIWFASLRHGVIAMDDVEVIKYYSNDSIGFIEKIFMNIGANRYRPVFYLFQFSEYSLFGKNYQLWFYFNVLFNAMIVAALYNLVFKITKSMVLPFAICLLYITSRFSYYNIVQLNGILEAICLLLLIRLMNHTYDYWHKKSPGNLLFAILLYSLMIFTHERYIVLIGFLIALIFLTDSLSLKQKLFYACISFAPLLLNILIKVKVFKIPFFVGAGSAQELGFNLYEALAHYYLSVLNILGINLGPGYLYALTFDSPEMAYQYKKITICIMAIPLSIIGMYIFRYILLNRDKESRIDELKKSVLAVLLICLIILSFSITIRVEQRWLYAPFIVYIVYLAYCISMIMKNSNDIRPLKFSQVKNASIFFIILLLVGLSVKMDLKYKKYIDRIFFMGHMSETKNVLDATYGKYGKSLESYDVYVFDSNAGADWSSFLNSRMAANSDLNIIRVTTVNDIRKIPSSQNKILLYSTVGQFAEIVFQRDLKKAQLLSGQYEVTGGFYISKNVSAFLNTGIKGLLRGKLIFPEDVRLPNGITVYLDDKIIYSHKYYTVGEYDFQAICDPNINAVVKIDMDKAIIPKKLGLGEDQRELSAILRVFYFE